MSKDMGVWCIRSIGMEGYGCAGVWVCGVLRVLVWRGMDVQGYGCVVY